LGHSLKLSENKLNELSLLSTLHDIGKIAIPDEILMKPGKLTEKEWDIVKRHPEVGYNISGSSPQLEPIADAVLSHHEWWDGSGYPQGLKGENIPLISRIISIIDAYDVMTHDRSYKKAVSKKESLEELKRCAGTQFDPKLVKIFIQVLS
ncbi:MAG: HD-GYP domain-containing protein, partial [Candidatus Hydromicrobium sp.]